MKFYFLSYINRSGSSFIAQQLSKYDDIFVFPEGDALIDKFLLNNNIKLSANYLIRLFTKDKKLCNWNITKNDICKITKKNKYKKDIFFNILITFKNKYKPNAKILIFKKRDAFIKYNKIKNIINDEKIHIISVIRDSRAIFLSQKKTIDPYSKKPFNVNPLITAYYWNFYLKNIKTLNDSTLIKYEDVVNNKTKILNNILGIISSNKLISQKTITYIDLLSDSEKKLHSKINSLPQKKSLIRWKEELKTNEILIINKICRNNLIEQDYNIDNLDSSATYYFWYLYFKLRIFFKIDVY